MKRPKQALADLDESIRLMPDMAQTHIGRCGALMAEKRLEDALVSCNKAVELEPKGAALGFRAMLYLRMKNYKAAIADCDAVLAQYPKTDGTLYTRGMAKTQSGDASGDADIAAAKAINPNVAKDWDALQDKL